METCEKCPKNTRPNNERTKFFPNIINTRCLLYDGYDINGNYMLHMINFDSTYENNSSLPTNSIQKTRKFFGPITNDNKSSIFFFSLSKPTEYNIENYEYDEESISEGHIFALFTFTKHTEERKGISQIQMQKAHVHEKKNLGSRLSFLDLSHSEEGNIILNYDEGDICEDGKHKSQVTLTCDKTVGKQNEIEYLQNYSTSILLLF